MSDVRVLKLILFGSGLALLLAVTWALRVYHLAYFPRPQVEDAARVEHAGRWIDKAAVGVNELVLEGNPYERGLESGRLTQKLLDRQESELNDQLNTIFPSPFFVRLLELGVMRWFWGIDRYIEAPFVEEMYGVSKSAPARFNSIADPLTRQVAYHGLHEVGQMMVDQGGEGMGCTVVAIPRAKSWTLGRNFDFEAGRVFDEEKIVKWVFPDHGHAFVSVIWAGMVGGVTGVNDQGLYISLNAAGSRDFRRYGTPSTLVLVKALAQASNAREALEILKHETMFITDIFVVMDAQNGELYRVEKSPLRTEAIRLDGPSVVANHLVSKTFEHDSINEFRRSELTSHYRQHRGEELVNRLGARGDLSEGAASKAILEILRDKGVDDQGHELALGNRRAIDPLIATHSVVYDGATRRLYVSKGPGVSGAFVGYDLRASFAKKQPVHMGELEADPRVSRETFYRVREASQAAEKLKKESARGDCKQARSRLDQAALAPGLYLYWQGKGNFDMYCKHDLLSARQSWSKALQLAPAYRREVEELQKNLKLEDGRRVHESAR